jgi:hypothetical protein
MGSGGRGLRKRGFYRRGVTSRHAMQDTPGLSGSMYGEVSLIKATRKGCNQEARDYSPAQFPPTTGCGVTLRTGRLIFLQVVLGCH